MFRTILLFLFITLLICLSLPMGVDAKVLGYWDL